MMNGSSDFATYQGCWIMKKLAIPLAAGLLFLWIGSQAQADEPIGKPRIYPAPAQGTYELMPPLQGTTGFLPPTIPTRQNRYEHWQYVGVTQTRQWAPRVLVFPDGQAFWADDGTWYPWLSTHMTWVVPFFIGL